MDRGDLDIEQRGRVAEGLRFSVGGVDDHAGVVEVRHDLRNDPAEPGSAERVSGEALKVAERD